ncbi:MAG: CBS domain-containing protein [Parasulfuritortus sp.]|jgi:CBS-domain-containing membrane protein|nr:CBS domain-containing protein [Parasulfuritortus sp.]
MSTKEQELEIELSDEDILDAMKHFEGYVDVFSDDFRAIYHHAHHHAVRRLTAGLKAEKLMRRNVPLLSPDLTLDLAAQTIVQSGYKGLPVVDPNGMVIGMLTETDFLRRLKVDTFLELLLNMMAGDYKLAHRCHDTPVGEAMTAGAVCVAVDAGFADIFRAFREHEGRSMPVVDATDRPQGLILRKDFLSAAHLERLL